MAFKQKFFVQVFGVDGKHKLIERPALAVQDETAAVSRAEALRDRVVGVIAFSQLVDDATDDREEPVLLAAYGRVPAEARRAVA